MKTRQFHPTPSELPLLLDGRQNALVRPMKNSPSDYPNVNDFTEALRGGKLDNNPFGSSNDFLWCKERWWSDWKDEAETEVCYAYEQQVGDIGVEWQPSITMPKSACRLWLEVLEVKVCRASEVTDEMAAALGFAGIIEEQPIKIDLSPKESFSWFWDHEYPNQEWLWYCSVQKIEKP